MSQEDAIMPMKRAIYDSLPKVMNALNETISRTTEKGKIIIVGVGNTSGIGNNRKSIEKAKKIINENIKKMKKLEKSKKRTFNIFPEWS
jgi:pheromone shutdown protein TraB